NIKVISLDVASGSASTPRNIGMTHARAPYLTFLDPDNEWVGDGINQLLEAIQADGQGQEPAIVAQKFLEKHHYFDDDKGGQK
ncbi:glycosyltransferase, partial [Staphylococcus hyicus]|uniref:glycosyltransferase n=1 Tax=Staphylococcus hyicus TaxID=1284 RepID=UPI00142FE10A